MKDRRKDGTYTPDGMRRRWKDPASRARMAEASRKRMANLSPDQRAALAERGRRLAKKNWQDPKIREQLLHHLHSTREQAAAKMRDNWSKPELRAKWTKAIAKARAELLADPARVARMTSKSLQTHRATRTRRVRDMLANLPPPAPAGEHAIGIEHMGNELRLSWIEPARQGLQLAVALNGQYASRAYKLFRKTGHRGDQQGPYGASIPIDEAKQIVESVGISMDRAQAWIQAVFTLTQDHSLLGPFPINPGRDYAFLLGLYFGCGAVDRRELQLRFRVDRPVADELQELGRRIGAIPSTSSYMQRQSRLSLLVGGQRTVRFPRPLTYALLRLGMPQPIAGEARAGRKTATRIARLGVPDFVKEDPVLQHAFVEGYLNTTSLQVAVGRQRRDNKLYTGFHGDVHITGRAKGPTEEFAQFIAAVLRRYGVGGTIRRQKRKGKSYGLAISLASGANGQRLLHHFKILTRQAGRIREILETPTVTLIQPVAESLVTEAT